MSGPPTSPTRDELADVLLEVLDARFPLTGFTPDHLAAPVSRARGMLELIERERRDAEEGRSMGHGLPSEVDGALDAAEVAACDRVIENLRASLARALTPATSVPEGSGLGELIASVSQLRRQVETAHQFLDNRDAPRRSPQLYPNDPERGVATYTLAGRIEQMTEPGGPWVRLDSVVRYLNAQAEGPLRPGTGQCVTINLDGFAREFGVLPT